MNNDPNGSRFPHNAPRMHSCSTPRSLMRISTYSLLMLDGLLLFQLFSCFFNEKKCILFCQIKPNYKENIRPTVQNPVALLNGVKMAFQG